MLPWSMVFRLALLASASLSLASCSPSAATAPSGADAGVTAAQCPRPQGPGTVHDGETIAADATWTAAASPHFIRSPASVKLGATLHLEPCAEVRIAADSGMLVEGRLEAPGTAAQPILITADDASKPFSFIEVRAGFADLSYVTLARGGAVGANSNAMLDVWGKSDGRRSEHARLRHVTMTGSEQFGLTLERDAALSPDSDSLAIHGAKRAPVAVYGAAAAGSIPPGDYSGNAADEIMVVARDAMTEDTVWHARGVPYHLGDSRGNGTDFRVGASTGAAVATWTLEAGVTLRVDDTTRILAQKSGSTITGSVIARGTASAPVVFTSASSAPKAGQWRGLVFEATPAPSTSLDYLEIRYAGGPSQANSFHCKPGTNGGFSSDEDAALAIFGEPASAFLTHATVADSAGDGVDLAYSGAAVDFAAGNTFTAVARCRVTLPRAKDGSCPSPVPACN